MSRIEICLWKIRSLRCRFMQNWVFLRTLFLENEVQIDRNNYVTIFKKNLFIYLLNKNSIIYTTHITILNSQYIIKHYLQYIIKILEINYVTMLFMSKQVSLPKISSILQKMKIGQNSIYTLFPRSPSFVKFLSNQKRVCIRRLLLLWREMIM